MSMAENKPGESVVASYEQIDADGYRIAEATIKYHGFDRDVANIASMDLVKGIFRTADGWREARLGGKSKG